MSMADRIPSMSDQDLKVLHANAARLNDGGTKQQQAAAAELLPAIEAELDQRKTAATAEKARIAAEKPKKTRAKKVA